MTRIALLRHGHTPWNRAGRIQGRTDIPLDPDAAEALAHLSLPAPWQDAAIWSSPLKRAVQTAELVARAPLTDPRLSEMNWGDWEGAHGTDLRADPDSGYRDMEHWGWDFTPPGGERLSDLRDRVLDWAEAQSGALVAVCHIGVMRVLLAHAHGWDFTGPAPFAVKRNRLFVVERSAKGWQAWDTPVRLVAR